MGGGQLLRLTPNVSSSWYWYPKFQERVLAFNHEYLREFTQQQNAILVDSLQKRWINTPLLAGYWLAVEDSKPVGHAACWVTEDCGKPHIYIYQVESAPGYTEQWLADLAVWKEEVNQALTLKSPNSAFIDFCDLATFHEPEVMQRLLEGNGAKNIRVRSLIRFDL